MDSRDAHHHLLKVVFPYDKQVPELLQSIKQSSIILLLTVYHKLNLIQEYVINGNYVNMIHHYVLTMSSVKLDR